MEVINEFEKLMSDTAKTIVNNNMEGVCTDDVDVLPVNNNVLYLDMAFALGLVAIAVVPTIIRGKFSRIQGFALFATYVVYIVLSSILHL